jgi:hypothetical protein
MRLGRRFFAHAIIVILIVCGGAQARADAGRTIALPRAQAATSGDPAPQYVLKYKYRVRCDRSEKPVPRLLTGSIALEGRTVRVELFDAARSGETLLGALPSHFAPELKLDANPNCTLAEFSPELLREPTSKEVAEIAFEHAPFLVVRKDQFKNPRTDLPLVLAYSVNSEGTSWSLRYTLIFSDEDSLSSVRETEAQMARYGRRTDIEWLYEVTFDPKGKILKRIYQGDILRGWGHSRRAFRGKFVAGTQHPILYDIASHNVFLDHPSHRQKGMPVEGHALVPRIRIDEPRAREWVMIQNPWIYQVSDEELAYEHKLLRPSTEYLLALLRARLDYGSFIGRVQLATGSVFLSGGGAGAVSSIGQGLYGEETCTAIPLGGRNLASLEKGKLPGAIDFVPASRRTQLNLKIFEVHYFRLIEREGTYDRVELTDRVREQFCRAPGYRAGCLAPR